MGFGQNDGDDVKIKGVDSNGDAQELSAFQDASGNWRLFTKGETSLTVSDDEPHHFVKFLENGGNRSMNVDGSSTPQTFSFGPGAGKIWYVYELRIVLSDLKVDDRDKFGDVAGPLTNGVLIQNYLDSTAHEVVNLKRNAEIAATYNYEFSSKSDLALSNESALFVGYVHWSNIVVLKGDRGDKIEGIVRDDLTGLDELLMTFKAYEVLA